MSNSRLIANSHSRATIHFKLATDRMSFYIKQVQLRINYVSGHDAVRENHVEGILACPAPSIFSGLWAGTDVLKERKKGSIQSAYVFHSMLMLINVNFKLFVSYLPSETFDTVQFPP
jgi:hypothetical protein